MHKGYENDKALMETSNTIYNNPHKQKRKMKHPNVQVTFQRMFVGTI